MRITEVNIQNLRLFKKARFHPSTKINLIYGDNGSGKTTVLESIYLLARSRSFRSKSNSELISHDEKELYLSANLQNNNEQKITIGIKRTKNKTNVRLSGQTQNKISELAKSIPLNIITPNTQKIFTEGPKNRRRFLDWGVFHVEHNYADLVSLYYKILGQRNAWIKRKEKNYRIWDKQLSDCSKQIDYFREKYFKLFILNLRQMISEYHFLKNLQISYKRGWSKDLDLIDLLNFNNDEIYYPTQKGPHRADIVFNIGKQTVQEFLSRGEQKILAILLILCQINITKDYIGENPILLIDDITSELDEENQKKIFQIISDSNIQVFLTLLNKKIFIHNDFDVEMFHVEHNQII